ncbi:hypothetical protein IA826_02235 [Listeria seeligeri]|uniref:hypothetical protein n=1 Tax=Listeria seeligeri TaxID=1640 RepID=UPI0016239348|nr:hypothetical protein [Listeria seeligeri]MBC2069883.1 hypothetical protein [Listeria seeligeri]MBC2087855.1 hypothetical protein [Listeria seeligeri]MBF2400549.1 hypothetical protein [Listeria seeligeri]MBF2499596.1 hypothetical protein [Listeria seeligeri]MBF2651836.1 hypothetical protein [Listeria seeligeri]
MFKQPYLITVEKSEIRNAYVMFSSSTANCYQEIASDEVQSDLLTILPVGGWSMLEVFEAIEDFIGGKPVLKTNNDKKVGK